LTSFYPPAPSLAGHPYLPERLGYLRVLEFLQPDVGRLLRTAKDYTLMSARNLTTLYREGQRILHHGIQGDFVEIGVHRGGSAAILAALIKSRNCELHLFDRWGDLPQPTERDGFREMEYRKDRITDKLARLRDDPPLDHARHLLEGIIGFPTDRLHYYPGWYSETFGKYPGSAIAFASLDCDYYESVRDALEFVDRFASLSATIVADDYGSWPGARTAIDEWIDRTTRAVKLYALRTGPAVIRFGGYRRVMRSFVDAT
jgi:O-methyltransferase